KTLAVVALVEVLQRLEGVARQLRGLEEPARREIALLRLSAMAVVLRDVQRGQVIGRCLADVVELASEQDRPARLVREPDALEDLACEARDLRAMTAQLFTSLLEQRDEHRGRLDERLRFEGPVVASARRSCALGQLLERLARWHDARTAHCDEVTLRV